MKSTESTPVSHFLDEKGVEYRRLEHAQPALTCEDAARERSVSISEMVKCLVLRDKKKDQVHLACIPGDRRLSMSKFRRHVRASKLAFCSDEEIATALGFKRGAIPPIALPDGVNAVADSSFLKRKQLNLSSGSPMAGLEVSTWEFRRVFQGSFVDIIE